MLFFSYMFPSFIFLVSFIERISSDGIECPCQQKCGQVTGQLTDHGTKKEVMIIGDSDNDVNTVGMWKWQSFSHLLDTNPEIDINSTSVMCTTHQKNKKYGFYVDFPTTYDEKSSELSEFVTKIQNRAARHYADFVAVDMLQLLGPCNFTTDHITNIIKVTNNTFPKIKNISNLVVYCVLPWKPPCIKSDCQLTPYLSNLCDAMILSPDSYFDYCDDSCIAKATVQASKIYFGVTEYEAYGFQGLNILMGIPWYGYNYTCEQYANASAHPMCKLKTKQVTQADNTTHTVCDIAGSRTKFRLGGINGIQDMVLETKNYSLSDQTPYHVYNVTPEGSNDLKFQMAWFENIGSLWFKYDLVRKLQLRGTVIYTGDDLTYTSTGEDSGGFDGKMWSWIHHYLFSTSDGSEVSKEKNLAGMMAGIGIGLFVLGCVLGLILACIALRKTKKPLRVPFSSDPVVEDYYDEDNRL
ncbi:di-N-acetylchitobiase-like [Mya arenaria]|uniref:di-N-acetylchitobiase-like n=1 Tax=Mya arenaria TaxID=6604 RepID=UPI0022E5DF4B|nr:di-N-acetylchitobiase-like [Mya arenaria]